MSQKCLLVKASELCQIRMSLTLVGKPFLGLRIFSKWLLDRRICRCAIPNRAALPVRFSRGEGVDPCRKSILRNTLSAVAGALLLLSCKMPRHSATVLPAFLLHPDAPEMNRRAPELFHVRLETSRGLMVIEVHRDWSPHGADRFYNLVRAGYYDEARFFRVIQGRWAQAGINGDPKISNVWRTRTIPDDPRRESNVRGTMAYAFLPRMAAQRRCSSTCATILPLMIRSLSCRSEQLSKGWWWRMRSTPSMESLRAEAFAAASKDRFLKWAMRGWNTIFRVLITSRARPSSRRSCGKAQRNLPPWG